MSVSLQDLLKAKEGRQKPLFKSEEYSNGLLLHDKGRTTWLDYKALLANREKIAGVQSSPRVALELAQHPCIELGPLIAKFVANNRNSGTVPEL